LALAAAAGRSGGLSVLGRNKIDQIIREEMTHITILNRELAALQSPT
jgi:hypothetical protein